MKRVKLQYRYHDALIRAIRYRDDSDVVFEVELCSCCNPTACPATLTLLGVRNFTLLQKALEAARLANSSRGYVDEFVSVGRSEERGYLLDLASAGTLHVDARGLHEA
jgi:hypothetical protein